MQTFNYVSFDDQYLKIGDWTDPTWDILEIIKEAIKASPYAESPKEERLVELISLFLNGGNNILFFLYDQDKKIVGLLAATISEHIFTQYKIATELVFYVKPENRGKNSWKLVEAFEEWGKLKEAKKAVIAHYQEDSLGAIYKRKGYKLIEQSYMKEIG